MRIQRTFFSFVCLIVFCQQALLGAESKSKPNFIVIFADDLGYGDLECYGHPRFKTPNLNQMAAEGARLTQFNVPVPYCAPSRATLLTGRYPWRHGVWFNPAPDGGRFRSGVGIAKSELLLSELLKENGYATICVGKWHLGHDPQFYPTRHGFDDYLGILYSNDMRPVNLFQGEKVVEYPVIQANLTKRYTNRALKFIRKNQKQPFFLYLPHAMPHKPLAASEAFYKKSGAGLYGDVIAELDWSVGEIFKALKELNLDENTFVIFTSDNGPWYGGHTAGLSGMKSTSWEGGLRVPMIARWPGKIPPQQVIDTVCGSIDIFPTILKQANIKLPTDRIIDGKDLFPVLTEKADSPHTALYSMKGNALFTIRSGPWKLHVKQSPRRALKTQSKDWIDPRGPDGVTIIAPYEQAMPNQFPGLVSGDQPASMMLFNLKDDSAEQHNVAKQNPQVVARLKKLYDEMHAQVPDQIRNFNKQPQKKSLRQKK
ncbi:sulfatase family protein [Gimesia aquarii]|uniref:Arylsulfatase n=1 Tax=Gimesia aquarii TaxID=2527964 RepID=A0A517VSV6_9PLAN|nr:sulfatase [Gimesia aquarii]QDT96086.1 Arylsulfatase precursor [Gimesia aquarii]